MSLALQGRGMFSGVLELMGIPRCGTLDCSGSTGRLHSPFPLSPSFVIYADPPSELFPLLHLGVSSRCCSGRLIVQRCHRAGISKPRFLQSPFRHPEGHSRLASSYRSVLPQSLCSAVSFPHGVGPVSPPIHPPWRLDDFSRPSRRLPPGSCPSGVSEVSAFLSRRQGLSMCFGLSAAPQVFSRVMAPVSSIMLRFGFRILCYLDDWLVLESSLPEITRARDFLLALCSELGIQVNLSKSSLTPSQRQDYLGVTLQSSPLRAFPTQARVQKVLCLVDEFSSSRVQPLNLWRSLLGVMSSLSTLIPGSRLRILALQHRLQVSRPQESPAEPVSWDYSCRRDLRWWSDHSHLVVGVDLALPHPELLFTDVSDAGWGASLGSDHLSSLWSPDVSLFSISHRELLAVFLAILRFLHLLRGRSVSLFTDNTSALSYLRKEGGTRSSTLNSMAQEILRLCESNGVRLLPQFVPGCLNVLADSLSRRGQILGSEWTLSMDVCLKLFRRWLVTVDLFATSLNHRLQVYFSPMADPQATAVDAMIQSWDHVQAYAFPPFGLIQRVLSIVRGSRNLEVTLVAPFWPLSPWFLDLLDLVDVPVLLPKRRDLLRQPHFHQYHRSLRALRLTGFCIASDLRDTSASL